jgi:hypothetical protein
MAVCGGTGSREEKASYGFVINMMSKRNAS